MKKNYLAPDCHSMELQLIQPFMASRTYDPYTDFEMLDEDDDFYYEE